MTDQWEALLAESLIDAELGTRTQVAACVHSVIQQRGYLDVDVAIADLDDWALRSKVLQVCGRFGESHRVRVRVYFCPALAKVTG